MPLDEAIKGGIETIKRLEDSLCIHQIFDLAKVFSGKQPGDFIASSPELLGITEALLNELKEANPEFQYIEREKRDGSSVLSAKHWDEIARIREQLDVPHDNRGETIFFFYHVPSIEAKQKKRNIADLVGKVTNIREFLDIINYAPKLSNTKALQRANYNIGTYFGFMPCCLEHYSLQSEAGWCYYLAEEYQMYVEFVPCRADCAAGLSQAEVFREFFGQLGLNADALRSHGKKGFRGFLFFNGGHDLHNIAKEHGAILTTSPYKFKVVRDYAMSCPDRDKLRDLYVDLGHHGATGIITNTIL